MIIGVVADTHGILNPQVLRLFAEVDLILHAGDVGDIEVIRGLEGIARVIAVRGNNDRAGPTSYFCKGVQVFISSLKASENFKWGMLLQCLLLI